MTTLAENQTKTVQVYRVFIKATPQAIWDAITQPGWAEKYGYACRQTYDLRPGGAFKAFASAPMKAHGVPDEIIVGEIIESNPPTKLVQTWHPIWDPGSAAEKPTLLTYEIEPQPQGFTKLTVIHDVTGAPIIAKMVAGEAGEAGGGWAWILSDLKTLLETGTAMGGGE